jgi:hypothetical protein
MANVSKIAGLSPVGYLGGAKYDGKGRIYAIPSTDSTNNYFVGDLVSLVGGGSAGGSTVTGIPYVSLTAAGAAAVGVIMAVGTKPGVVAVAGGPYINPQDLSKVYAPITKAQDYYCLVADDPNVIFEIQEGGAGTNLTASTALGRNANILLGASATASTVTTFVSGTTLTDTAAPTTTATLNLKIIAFAQRPDNLFYTTPSTGGAGQKWWVLINNHNYRAGIAAL